MPAPTPFHPRTFAACTSLLYKEWAGCYAVRRYDVYLDREYYAVRHQATVMGFCQVTAPVMMGLW